MLTNKEQFKMYQSLGNQSRKKKIKAKNIEGLVNLTSSPLMPSTHRFKANPPTTPTQLQVTMSYNLPTLSPTSTFNYTIPFSSITTCYPTSLFLSKFKKQYVVRLYIE